MCDLGCPCATGEVPVHDITGEGGGVGYDKGYKPVGTILEGAQLAGKLTGIVTTTRVTHATPAAFSSHVSNRDDENEIALEQIYSLDLNVLMGGGRRHFDHRSTAGSKRSDDVDLIAAAKTRGYDFVFDARTMRSAADAAAAAAAAPGSNQSSPPRLLGLFAPSHLPYEIDVHGGFDRNSGAGDAAPALDEMTAAALKVLSAGEQTAVGRKGFFLLVEAGRIDHGGHANDAGAALAEVCAYNRAFKAAVDFAASRPDVLVVGSSDHDTGGMSVGCCGKYALNVTEMKKLKASAEEVTSRVSDQYVAAADPAAQGVDMLVQILAAAGRTVAPSVAAAAASGVGGSATDGGDVSVEDLSAIHSLALKVAAAAAGGGSASHGYEGYDLQNKIGEVLNKPNLVGFTSHGHTGVDVPLFAFGASSSRFKGYMENTEVGKAMIDLLGVDPAAGYEAFVARVSAAKAQAESG